MKRLIVLLLTTALLAVGCGLPSDEDPTILALDEIPQSGIPIMAP